MSRIRVARFESRAGAEQVQQHLARAGISAEVHDELGLAKLWFVTKRRAGVRLEVPRERLREAERLLHGQDTDFGRQGIIRCPECSSLRVDFPQFTQKSLFTNLAIGLVAELGLVERQYYCEECHCMWNRPDPKPRRPRAHMAPNYFIENKEPPSSQA
jgi:hypothetical protein